MIRKALPTTLFMLILFGIIWFYSEDSIYDDAAQMPVDAQGLRVIDGDSFAIGREEYRIYGIDAPEYRQLCSSEANESWPCGKESRSALEILLKEDGLKCTSRARDKYGRAVVTCHTNDSFDIAETMVHRGWAVATGGDFSGGVLGGPYDEAQENARTARRGIWRGAFVIPADWRAQNKSR